VDDTALFSITEAAVADEQTKVIAKTLSDMGIDPSKATITDGTANVGGNTISFGKVFENVNAVEIGPLRAPLLANNIYVAKLQDKVVIHCADYLEAWKVLKQDAIFMDPPWGGKGYKEKAVLDMFLGATNVIDLIIQMISFRAASVIAMKAPTNYNITGLTDSIVASTTVKKESIQVIPMKKQLLIVIKVEGPKESYSPHTPPYGGEDPLYYSKGVVTPPAAAAGGGGGGGTAGGARKKTRSARKLQRKTRRHTNKKNPIEYAKQFASIWKVHAKIKTRETIE
jgi:predicted RNA methylase